MPVKEHHVVPAHMQGKGYNTPVTITVQTFAGQLAKVIQPVAEVLGKVAELVSNRLIVVAP